MSLLYFDSSALVKLVVEERESAALAGWIEAEHTMATSRLAEVEVERAARIANPSETVARDTRRVLDSCLLVDVSRAILGDASRLTSALVRTPDAIHLATALRLQADALVGYDDRLATAARARGLRVVTPG